MTIDGWVAIGNQGVLLSSFREGQAEAETAGRQALRLLGGQPLVGGFRLAQATLTVHDTKGDDVTESRSCTTNS
jgi:photosystem II stability/assembly factor-like uncharacterized protein